MLSLFMSLVLVIVIVLSVVAGVGLGYAIIFGILYAFDRSRRQLPKASPASVMTSSPSGD